MSGNFSEILSEEKINYLKKNLNKFDLKNFFDIVSVAGTNEVISRGIPNVYEGTHQFIRDIETAQLLKEKFPNMAYDSAEGFKEWLANRISGSTQSKANALSRMQGDGAGEVDFIREMRGSLFSKIDYARNSEGNIASNIPGIDAQETSRITGKVLKEFQVKTLRTEASIHDTLKGFVENRDYKEGIVLVGPKELIEEAKRQGLPNPTKIMGSIKDNANSAKSLEEKVLSGYMVTELNLQAVVEKVAGGVAIGAVISVGISSLFNYIDYKNGKISKKEMISKIGKDGAKGAITGGALAGLSLFIPPGVIGFGVGFVVGTVLRRALDDAFGDGIFAEILDLTKSVQANVELLHNGSVYIAELVEADGKQIARAINTVNELERERLESISRLQELEEKYGNMQVVLDDDISVLSRLDNLDRLRARLEKE